MPRKNLLKDGIYSGELDRMRMLKRFPELPAGRQEMIRVMRQITNERKFLQDLVTFFVDNAERCPTPHELHERAGRMRAAEKKPLGQAGCEHCGGSGWVRTTRMVRISGLEPYEAESSRRCTCAAPIEVRP